MSHLCSGASSIRGVRDRVERIAPLSRRKFRVRYDRIVSFDPYDDGFGIMRDAQTAKPQTFRTGDGRFPHNLAANLDLVQVGSQLHPTSHPCCTRKPLCTTERDGSATRALRTPGPSLPSSPEKSRPKWEKESGMQTNGPNGHQHEVSEKRPPPGAFPCRLDMELCACGAKRWVDRAGPRPPRGSSST